MLKLLEKFFKGNTVLETADSSYNGIIKVDEDLFGHKRLVVGNIAQSGKEVEKVWESIIDKLSNCQIANCLILGLGAGNAAKIVNKYFPKAKITGIEIDPEIILLGNRYFGLDKVKNLDITISDAISFISEACRNAVIHKSSFINHFDLILVDLYLGDCFPEKAGDDKFLLEIKKILNPKGLAIFNRLYYKNNIQKVDIFQKKLLNIFPKIEAKKIDYNKIFLCRK